MSKIQTLLDTIHRVFGSFVISHNHREVLNFDRSSLGNLGRSEFGGVIRNSLREWIYDFSCFYGYTANLNAELFAIFYGLDTTWRSDYRAVVCESNSLMAISLVSKGLHQLLPYAPLVNQIRLFMSRSWILFNIPYVKATSVLIS